jgi:hypothetical protein
MRIAATILIGIALVYVAVEWYRQEPQLERALPVTTGQARAE